jgi:hypothetical protein
MSAGFFGLFRLEWVFSRPLHIGRHIIDNRFLHRGSRCSVSFSDRVKAQASMSTQKVGVVTLGRTKYEHFFSRDEKTDSSGHGINFLLKFVLP